MRRLNLFLVVGMLVTFLAHAVMGALQLSGANTNTLKPLAWVCVGMMAAHIVVSAVLTVQTLYACKKSGTGYFAILLSISSSASTSRLLYALNISHFDGYSTGL